MIFVLLPLMILTGLTMSPGMDAILPWLVDIFGGRQSARTIHFITASLIVLFVFVHVAMVLLAGPMNELRSMITGKFVISVEDIMSSVLLPRRRFLALGAAGLGGTLLSGCDRLSEAPDFQEFLSSAEGLTYRVQRLLGGGHALAREFTASRCVAGFQGEWQPDARGRGLCGLAGKQFCQLALARRRARRQSSGLVA